MTLWHLISIRNFLNRVVAKGDEEKHLVECVEALDKLIDTHRNKKVA